MITYKSVATKEDQLFLANCRRVLGHHEFNSLVPKVRKAFQEAYKNEPNVNKKVNVARRAANIIYTDAVNCKNGFY